VAPYPLPHYRLLSKAPFNTAAATTKNLTQKDQAFFPNDVAIAYDSLVVVA
jgi:hypothetical protein